MTDQMDAAAGPSNDRLQRIGFVRNGSIASCPALSSSAIAEQARGDAAKLVIPRGDDRPPRGSGAARSGHEHNRWPGPGLILIDAATLFLYHDENPVLVR